MANEFYDEVPYEMQPVPPLGTAEHEHYTWEALGRIGDAHSALQDYAANPVSPESLQRILGEADRLAKSLNRTIVTLQQQHASNIVHNAVTKLEAHERNRARS